MRICIITETESHLFLFFAGVLATGIMAVNAIIYGNPYGAVSGDQFLDRSLPCRFAFDRGNLGLA